MMIITNINVHLTILNKQIKADSIRHNVVSEYDGLKLDRSYN